VLVLLLALKDVQTLIGPTLDRVGEVKGAAGEELTATGKHHFRSPRSRNKWRKRLMMSRYRVSEAKA